LRKLFAQAVKKIKNDSSRIKKAIEKELTAKRIKKSFAYFAEKPLRPLRLKKMS